MGIRGNQAAWPAVGTEQKTTYGGMSGNAARPLALKAVSAITKTLPGYPIMATGGIDSAEACLQFLYCGASVVQICSSIQNQDFTVVQDYISGLKCLLYLQTRGDLKGWDFQSPPRRVGDVIGRGLPKFGDYEKKRRELKTAVKSSGEEKVVFEKHASVTPASAAKVPSIKDQIGRAVSRIGTYNDLNNKEQVVALVDEEMCINCGKCYMTCNDSGYQAIRFDAKTHLPKVTDDCTGCTLCLSVCPIIDCITMVPRTIPYVPNRGVKA